MVNVSVLGTGAMGAAMARRLAEGGHAVTVWGRDPAKAAALAGSNITAATTVAEAVASADVVLTMVTDGPAVEQVAEQMLDALPAEAVWLQTSTVGAAAADRLGELATARSRSMVDAPVSGTTAAAEQGKLTWLVSGPGEAIEKARPVLDSLGSRTVVAGKAQEANRLKLVVNAWMLSAAVAMADALEATDRLGVDRSTFLDVLRDGSLAMPYALNKAQAMTAGNYQPGFPVELALKDVALTTDALGALPDLWRAVEQRLARTVEAGHGRDDVGAIAAVPGN